MKCSQAKAFLSQVSDRSTAIDPIAQADLDFLTTNGYVLASTKEDYDKGVEEVARLGVLIAQVQADRELEEQASAPLQQDQEKEHSFAFHFAGKDEKESLQQKMQTETSTLSQKQSELIALEANVNDLIQKKSMLDRMVAYGGEFLSLSDLGTVVLNDLNVRNYRVSDDEFTDFISEIKATYAELRGITDKAASYVAMARGRIPIQGDKDGDQMNDQSLVWSVAIGLAKLQGDVNQIAMRFLGAFEIVLSIDSTIPNKLMAAEIMTAIANQDLQSLGSALKGLEKQVRDDGVPKELSAGVAATIMAGRRYNGSYPIDNYAPFKQQTQSYEAAAILAVMNVPFADLNAKFQAFRSMFLSWGYMTSEDTEISSAFLAIGELTADEVQDKLRYIVEQLHNYLEYPLVAASILASIPVFESHELLDLMEKAVTLLSNFATGLERSELVALAVRMIHGVRNELVQKIDPTAKISDTPVQFTYAPYPGIFYWYFPVIVAHSSYNAIFSGMGGFHPAHSHGVGGFAG
jgi:hypothetical protein